jgi:hypothetical protein
MENIIEIECPGCHANLWVDVEKKVVVDHKKQQRRPSLLLMTFS